MPSKNHLPSFPALSFPPTRAPICTNKKLVAIKPVTPAVVKTALTNSQHWLANNLIRPQPSFFLGVKKDIPDSYFEGSLRQAITTGNAVSKHGPAFMRSLVETPMLTYSVACVCAIIVTDMVCNGILRRRKSKEEQENDRGSLR